MDDNRSCETCVHSSHYTVTGDLLCLGPAPVIFCKNVEHPCGCWEEEIDFLPKYLGVPVKEEEEENDGEDDI